MRKVNLFIYLQWKSVSRTQSRIIRDKNMLSIDEIPTSIVKKPDSEFLLLDLREESEYDKFHIRQGIVISYQLAGTLL